MQSFEYVYKIKNLTVIDIEKLWLSSLKDFNEFTLASSYTKEDALKLLSHFFFSKLLEIYSQKTTYNFLIFYTENSINIEEKIFNKNFRYLKNKIKFPIIISNLKIEEFISLLSDDSPEYDEIVTQNFSLIDKFKLIKDYMKRNGLTALYKKCSEEAKKTLGL